MVANEESDVSPSIECAELVELGDVSTETKGTFLGFNHELSVIGWWF